MVLEVAGVVVPVVGWSLDLVLPHADSAEAAASMQAHPYRNRQHKRRELMTAGGTCRPDG